MKKIFYSQHYIDQIDKASVLKSLSSNKNITSGKIQINFENNFSKYVGSKYSLSCSSGTAAIDMAMNSIELNKNDNVIIPAINFVAAANVCNQRGAKIFFADVDPKTGQMTPETLIKCIKENKIRKLKLFFSMYLGGAAKNIEGFSKIKKKYKSMWIEDACHALGGNYFFKNKKYKVGNCKYSDISIFSLHPSKIITAGEGGVLTTNKKKFFMRAKNFRSHSMIKKIDKYNTFNFYEVYEPGNNYRISEINCSLALSQLMKISKFLKKRKEIVNYYKNELKYYKDYIEI